MSSTYHDPKDYLSKPDHTDRGPAIDHGNRRTYEETSERMNDRIGGRTDESERTTEAVGRRAQELLERAIGPDATFRADQREAIERLVRNEERLLLVQRTGWGKSTVYFIATKLRRERGHGPTLIVSPLLALMHNQIQDAEEQLGLRAFTINSNNTDEWEAATEAVVEGQCDLLLISPERLANAEFREDILLSMDEEFGMLVVDEAHCISDWGHDFRPDYRRIRRILRAFPDHIPVVATTATANDRVVEDITSQVQDLRTIRGDLVRESLRIQANRIDSRARRLAWLAENVPELPSSGIVYCLTVDDVEAVASWLEKRGLDVAPYHGGIEGDRRRELEERLLENDVDGLVATNALGMGFNKPDLGWVVHFQRPPNLIRYYQEIGRAGRGLDEAVAVLLAGEGDDEVAEYFIESAFPEPEHFETVLATIEASEEPLSRYDLLSRANVSWRAATRCLHMLRVDNAIVKVSGGYERTGVDWSYDHDRFESVTRLRWAELERIDRFTRTDDCLTRFIDDELDGSLEGDCERCANCTGPFVPTDVEDEALVDAAVAHYKAESWSEIAPRYFLPTTDGRRKIDEERKPEPGRALCEYGDPGYGELVSRDRNDGRRYSQELVDAAVRFIDSAWDPSPAPTWVTAVPSTTGDDSQENGGEENDVVADLARRIADGLDLEYDRAVRRTADIRPQHELANSYLKRWNVDGAFETTDAVRPDPVLVVDDTVGSRWTFTEVSMTLRDAGSGPVYPFALATWHG